MGSWGVDFPYDGGGVDGGGVIKFAAIRAVAGKQVGNIIGHAGGNGTCSTVMCDGHAKEGSGMVFL